MGNTRVMEVQIVKTTSRLASEAFANEKRSLEAYGKDTVDYAIVENFREFYGRCLSAALCGGLADIEAKYAAIKAANSDVVQADGTVMKAVDFAAGGKGLAVAYSDGERLLFAWERSRDRDVNRTNVHVVPYREPAPEILAARLKEALESGAPLSELSPLATEFGMVGYPLHDEYSDATLLEDLVSKADEKGMTNGFPHDIGFVAMFNFDGSRQMRARGRVRDYSHRMDVVERIAATFALSDDPELVDLESLNHYRLVREGRATEAFASAAALAFEASVVGSLERLADIVSLSEALDLGHGRRLSYGDTDKHVYVHSVEGRDIVVHDDIDRNEQNVFVTVLNGERGDYRTIDVHVCEGWGQSFETWTDEDVDGPASEGGFYSLAGYLSERRGRPEEDTLISALGEGETALGLAYRYDLSTGELEIHPAGYRTGYLSCVGTVFEMDGNALNVLRSGDFSDVSGMCVKVREPGAGPETMEKHVRPATYVSSLTQSAKASSTGPRQ